MFGLGKYNYTADKTFRAYSFESNGPNGSIQKIAKFNEIAPNVYNFGFGDHDPKTGDISDTSVSNNQDTDTIMGTVGSIIYDFTTIFMDALIFIQGTNAARTRLYQININKHWARIEPVFEVFGLKSERWGQFKKAVNYDAFLGRRKGAFLLSEYQ
ncbi:MAG TPA: hypothetical protein VGN00_13260 [Puia sp.]|jgi:hypothetical protein